MKYLKLFFLILAFVALLNPAHALNMVIINNNGPAVGPFHLVSSNPHNWQTVSTPPNYIILTFSAPARADKSFIRLYNLNGDQLDTGELEAQSSNLAIAVNDLTYGKYVVKWRAYCDCEDRTEVTDSIHFTIQ